MQLPMLIVVISRISEYERQRQKGRLAATFVKLVTPLNKIKDDFAMICTSTVKYWM